MKLAVVVLAGAAGGKSPGLGGETPLAAARTDALDRLAREGRVGMARTTPRGTHAGSERTLLALLGCDPDVHPIARGPLEAIGCGAPLRPEDLAASGSLVTVADDRIVDLTAGRVSDVEARALLDALSASAADDSLKFVHLYRHRFVLIAAGGRGLEISTEPPHLAKTQSARLAYPRGRDAGRFERLLDQAAAVLGGHDVNRVRVDLGENPANGAWLWGAGADRPIPSFERTFFLRAASVAGAPVARGVAAKLGMTACDPPPPAAPEIPGADVDADLDGKALAALTALEDHDFVFVHVQAIRETALVESPAKIAETIGAIDERVIAPLAKGLAKHPRWRILVASDHGAADDPGLTPFLVAGDTIQAVRGWPFDEEHCGKSDFRIEEGAKLCEWFVG